MATSAHEIRRGAPALPLALGGLSAAIGALLLAGPPPEWSALVRFAADGTAARSGAALGILLGGATLAVVSLPAPDRPRRRRVAALLADHAGLLGALLLLLHVLWTTAGSDASGTGAGDAAQPARLAPNATAALGCLGFGLAMLASPRAPLTRLFSAAVCGALLTGLALISLLCNALGGEPAYGWTDLAQLPFAASVSLALLGPGLCLAARSRQPDEFARLGWLPLAGTLIAAAAVASTWQMLDRHQSSRLRALSVREARLLHHLVSAGLESRRRELRGIARRLAERKSPDGVAWAIEAHAGLERSPSYSALGWASSPGGVLGFSTRDEGGDRERARSWLEASTSEAGAREAAAQAAALSQLVLVEAVPGETQRRAHEVVVAVIRLAPLIEPRVLLADLDGFAFRVSWLEHTVLESDDIAGESPYDVSSRAAQAGSELRVRMRPLAPTIRLARSSGPSIVLLVGVLLSLLCGFAAYLWRRAQITAAEHRDEAEQHKLIFDCLSEGVAVANQRGELTLFNAMAEEILGLGPTDAQMEHWPHVYGIYPLEGDQHLPASELPMVRALRGESTDHFEMRCGAPSAPKGRIMSASGRPMRDANGSIIGGVVVFRDISAQKEMEEERAHIEIQLRHAQKLESVGRLAAGVAHEINTPAQFLSDNLRFLQRSFKQLLELLGPYSELLSSAAASGAPAPLVEKLKRSAEEIDLDYLLEEVPTALAQSLEGIGRVTNIVVAMKEFSHPGSPDKQLLDVNRAIQSTLIVSKNEWKYVAELETDFDAELPPVPCHGAEFNQAILNIVVNAAQALGELPSVKEGTKGRIAIRTRLDGEWAAIDVSDTGPGIPPSILGRIFEPFFTTKEVGKGTGQGLAITRSVIVDKHGGTIEVTSEPGCGTAFHIRLPLHPTPVPQA